MLIAAIENYHDLVRRDMFELIPERAGRVLDIGGGIGATSAALKAEGRAERAVVVDQVAGTTAAGIDRAVAGDLEDTAFLERVIAEEGQFDTILCLDILEHLRDPWAVMSVLKKALAPGGSIIISLPNVNYYSAALPLLFKGSWQLSDAGVLDRTHLRFFVRSTAIELATSSGLRLDAMTARIPAARLRLANILTLGLLKRFFVMQYGLRVRLA